MFASGSPMRIRRGTVADRARFAVRHGQRPARFGERGGARRTRRPRGGASEPDSGTAATERRQIPLRPHSAGPEHDEVRMHQEVRRTGSNGRSPAARRPLLPVRRRGGRAAHRRRRKGSNAARGAPTPVRAVGHHPRPQKSASEPSRWRTAMGLRVLRRATGDHAGRTALGRDARRCGPDEVLERVRSRRADLGLVQLAPPRVGMGHAPVLGVAVVQREPLVAVLSRLPLPIESATASIWRP